mmetsp:Transcript_35330/g.102029  ORF Transcript_35330/g.102029 Transcript_35330/m.102029 type:complete len:305 (+) Transcript_35330:883-1797(+)
MLWTHAACQRRGRRSGRGHCSALLGDLRQRYWGLLPSHRRRGSAPSGVLRHGRSDALALRSSLGAGVAGSSDPGAVLARLPILLRGVNAPPDARSLQILGHDCQASSFRVPRHLQQLLWLGALPARVRGREGAEAKQGEPAAGLRVRRRGRRELVVLGPCPRCGRFGVDTATREAHPLRRLRDGAFCPSRRHAPPVPQVPLRPDILFRHCARLGHGRRHRRRKRAAEARLHVDERVEVDAGRPRTHFGVAPSDFCGGRSAGVACCTSPRLQHARRRWSRRRGADGGGRRRRCRGSGGGRRARLE